MSPSVLLAALLLLPSPARACTTCGDLTHVVRPDPLSDGGTARIVDKKTNVPAATTVDATRIGETVVKTAAALPAGPGAAAPDKPQAEYVDKFGPGAEPYKGEFTVKNPPPVGGTTTEDLPADVQARLEMEAELRKQVEPPGGSFVFGRVVGVTSPSAPPPATPEAAASLDLVWRSLRSGNRDQARADAEAALKLHPDDPAVKDLAKRLAKHEAKLDTVGMIKKIGSILWNPEPGATALADRTAAGPASSPAQATQLATPLGALAGAGRPPTAATPPASQPAAGSVARVTLLKMQMADYHGAERDLTQKIEAQPDDWMSYRLRALTRRFLKKYPEAQRDAERAISLNPKDGPSHAVKALVRLDLDDAHGAVDEATQAVMLNPRDADALVTRGKAYMRLGRSEEALVDLREAAELAPQFGALYRRALAESSDASGRAGLSRARKIYGVAGGLALVLFGATLLSRRSSRTTAAPARPAMRSDDNNPTLGGFHILRRLGQGGMGVVYEAFDETLERRVALKRMRDEIAGDPRERRRFLKEARTVAALRHPGIVEIFSVVEQRDALYLVFEFLSGEPLNELLSKRGRLPPAEALTLGEQIAGALDFAHAHGVVHQDLKPANVVVTGGAAKVMDFGIARRVQETLSTLSRAEAMGTPAYMAPEQEHGVVTPKADLFAFGVCLYELLSGRPPYSGSNGYFAKAERRYSPLSQTAALPPAVDDVIAAALDPNPAKRPATAGDLVRSLQSALRIRA